jgi:regulator of sirC expression with transglutaminase-like and TPR domain
MTALDAFTQLVKADQREIPLLESAAALALYADPNFDPDRVTGTVRAWGERLAKRVPADTSSGNRLRLLNHFFFDELGFGPREDDVLGPEDSYLHRALERRTGLPITLSVLYLEIGRSIGLRMYGVSFPGHFLVRAQLAEGTLMIDVYERGATLSAEQLRARLSRIAPEDDGAQLRAYLQPASERDILARMLRNLKFVHAEASDWKGLLEVQQRLVALLPQAAEERRERAAAFERLECPRAAAADLEIYLKMQPRASDARRLRMRLAELMAEARNLN